MADWSYGDAGDRIPVGFGEQWRVGDHRLLCADQESSAEAIRQFVAPASGGLVYVDPPWDNGNARSFRTKSGIDGSKGRQVVLSGLLEKLVLQTATLRPSAVFYEMGLLNADMLADLFAQQFPGAVQHRYPIVYYRKHPCVLVQVYGEPLPSLSGKDDENTPGLVMDALRPSTVVDLCAGRGGTAVAAAERNIRSWGVELNPRRMAVALDKLSKLTGQPPERVA